MTDVSIRDLRNRGGDVVERAAGGEEITVTRAGKAVATLMPLPRQATACAVLVERRKRLARIDPRALRADIDGVLDTTL